jgi:hypothetical protein
MQTDFKMVYALKLVLLAFENISGFSINYSESEVIPFNLTEERSIQFTTVLNCKTATLI